MTVTKQRVNWKAKQARVTNLMAAMELCLEYARVKHNRSVERVASLMAIPSHWTLYKYVAEGRMPIYYLAAFENACGCSFVTEFLAVNAGKLVIDIPKGKRADASDINKLQVSLNDTVSALIRFYADEIEAQEALSKINQTMAELASHRANVAVDSMPELEF